MNLDQVAKVVGLVKNLFVILFISVVLISAVMIRNSIDEAFNNTTDTATTQEECIGEIC